MAYQAYFQLHVTSEKQGDEKLTVRAKHFVNDEGPVTSFHSLTIESETGAVTLYLSEQQIQDLQRQFAELSIQVHVNVGQRK